MKWLNLIGGVFAFWIDHPARAMIALVGLALIVGSAVPYMREAFTQMSKEKSEGGGNVTITNPTFNAPAQVGGQHNTMNINQTAYFSNASVATRQQGGRYYTRVNLVPSPGRTWAPGTKVGAEIHLDRPCLKWKVDPDGAAFSGVTFNEELGPEENTDVIVYRTTTPMAPSAPLVFEMEGEQPMKVLSVAASPNKP